MRNNKKLLFSFYGLAAGLVGAVIAELVPDFGTAGILIVGHVGAWSAVFAALIASGLTAAGESYNRRPFKATAYQSSLLAGAVAGGLAGSVAQAVYFVKSGDGFLQDVIFRALCWALMSAIIGWRLSSSIPNLGAKRGLLAGGIGGFLGGLGFVAACQFLPELLARSVGIGFLGLALGLAVVAVEALTREASLEVIWGPKEITSVGLGAKPVSIGGGDDDVYVAGIPEHAVTILLSSGKVVCTEKVSGKQSHLKNGSRIKMGRVELVVKTA